MLKLAWVVYVPFPPQCGHEQLHLLGAFLRFQILGYLPHQILVSIKCCARHLIHIAHAAKISYLQG